MRALVMYRIAFGLAAFATVLAWLAPGQATTLTFALLGLALIVCFGALVEAIYRCADALESRK